jgi:hypothetical protein
MLKHCIIVGALGLLATPLIATAADIYDASTNALPGSPFTRFDAQNGLSTLNVIGNPYYGEGFTPSPDQSVSGGIYDSGLTDTSKYTFWYDVSSTPLDESQNIVLSTNLKVISSTTAISGTPSNGLTNRAGVAMALTDKDDDYSELYFTPTSIFLNGPGRVEAASFTMDTTSAFHTYQMTVHGSTVTVSVDGTPELTGQTFTTSGAPVLPSWATLGDITSDAAGEYQMKNFSVAVLAPEPLTISFAAPLALLLRRRRCN